MQAVGGGHGARRHAAGAVAVESPRQRGGARNPVRIRDGRATVTGATASGSQELSPPRPLPSPGRPIPRR